MIKRLINPVIAGILVQWYTFSKMFTKRGQKELELDDINAKLMEALQEKTSEKIALRRKIFRDYASKKPKRSRFIPFRGKSNEKIKAEVVGKYGEEMNQVGLKITDDLQLK